MLYKAKDIRSMLFEILTILIKNDIAVNFAASEELIDEDDGTRMGGYFDGVSINVAAGSPIRYWFPIFLHEACHAEQAILDPSLMSRAEISHAQYGKYSRLDKLERLPYVHQKMVKFLEQDCERRVLSYIKQVSDFPQTYKAYLIRALIYVHSYDYTFKTGVWHGGTNAFYRKHGFVKAMGRKTIEQLEPLLMQERCPDWMMDLYEKYARRD